MKFIIALFLSSVWLRAADEMQVFSTTRTNAQSAVTTREFFTRGGQTNLVRHTKTKGGIVQMRIHQFYQDGKLLGDYAATADSSAFTSEAGVPFAISVEYGKDKEPKGAVIASGKGDILDAFTCTNGVFTPVGSSQLRKINGTSKAVRSEMETLGPR